ncbi:hypothetical protein GGI08_001439 [Coemansia sp. S2]|nr:hypothetical protein GGI08_001439 [Coemansia sp. S2]
MVKELRLNVPISTIANGTAHQLLTEFMGEIGALPFVHKLHIRVTHHTSGPEYLEDVANSCAVEFAQLLKSITPSLKVIAVSCDSFTTDLSMDDIERNVTFDEGTLVVFIDSLGNISNNHGVLGLEELSINKLSSISIIPEISTLRLLYKSDQEMRINLVHKCANTLQYLHIGICNAKSLVFDTNGHAVVYPSLHHLELYPGGHNTSIERVSVPNAVPFPILRTLNMSMLYPFADDVMFRGNCDTLVRLKMSIIYETVLMLNNSKPFESGYVNRRSVVVDGVWGDDSLAGIPGATMSKFMANLVGSARRLQSDNTLLVNTLASVVPQGHEFEFVKELDAYKAKLPLFNILRILQVLPSLVELRCGAFGLGPELAHIAVEDLPDHMASTYRDRGKNLQIWKLSVAHSSRDLHVSEYAMLLALACPTLHSVKLADIPLSDFKPRITDALQSGPYSKYASQLNRLLDVKQLFE